MSAVSLMPRRFLLIELVSGCVPGFRPMVAAYRPDTRVCGLPVV